MEHTERIANRLRSIADELNSLADSMATPIESVAFPSDAAERVAAKKCLICGKNWVKRGLCDTHYQRIDRQIQKNPALEAQLIALGKIAPPPPGRRKAKELDEILADLARDEIAASMQQQTNATSRDKKQQKTRGKQKP